jgi:hypothetical protein
MYAITPAMRLASMTKTLLRDIGCVKHQLGVSTIHLTAERVWQNNHERFRSRRISSRASGANFICADDGRASVVRGDMSQFSPRTRLPAINLRILKSCLQFFTIPMFKTQPDYLKI